MRENWEEIWGSEWNYVKRLGSAIQDPEEKKSFWENIKTRKLADASFSIYSLFPVNENSRMKAMRECVEHVRSLRRAKREEAS